MSDQPPSDKPKREPKKRTARVSGTVRREINVPEPLDVQIVEIADTKGYSYQSVITKSIQDYLERGPVINSLGKINEHQSLQVKGIMMTHSMVEGVAAEQQTQGERLLRVENMLQSMQDQLNRMEARQTNGPDQD